MNKIRQHYFSKLPQKRSQGGRRLHPQRHQSQLPQSVFEDDKAEETTEKIKTKSKKKKNWATFFI